MSKIIVFTFGENGLLSAELLEHSTSLGQSVTGLSRGDIETELLDVNLAHGVGKLIFLGAGRSGGGGLWTQC